MEEGEGGNGWIRKEVLSPHQDEGIVRMFLSREEERGFPYLHSPKGKARPVSISYAIVYFTKVVYLRQHVWPSIASRSFSPPPNCISGPLAYTKAKG